MKTSNPLQLFIQHGVSFTRQNTTNSIGNCIFCGKDGHFCANPETKAWDCKVCGKSGGFQSFLHAVSEFAIENFTGDKAKALAINRGLRVSTFQRFKVGYNPSADKYTIPVPFIDQQGGLWDLRHCNLGKSLMTTAGCQVGLLGWESLQDANTIWLCEGEWDGLTMDEILFRLHRRGSFKERIAAVPGANTFKADWFRFFKDKRVIVCYDNDQAGRLGSEKVYNSLVRDVKSIQFLHWPDVHPEGYDVRDCYNSFSRDEVKTMEYFEANLQDLPPVGAGSTLPPAITTTVQVGNGMNAADVYAIYQKWLYLPDIRIIDVIYGTIIANRQVGDPLWLFLVAEPGGTKTVPLISLSDSSNVITTTSLTPHALISGASFSGGGDPSLMALLNNRNTPAILVIKDFTTILNMPQQNREEIFGILRDAYDGKIEKIFGNGVTRRYSNCRFGILAGVTPAIEQHMEQNVQLGERFLSYRTPIPKTMKGRRMYIEAARNNIGRENEMAAELALVSKTVLDCDFGEVPRSSAEIDNAVISLAQFVSIMRGNVSRDRFSKEVTHKPFYELGTRLVKELTKLMSGVAQFRRTDVGEYELAIARDVAKSSIPTGPFAFVKTAWKQPDKAYTPKELSDAVGLPDFPTGRRIIENLTLLGIFEKSRSGRIGPAGDVYTLTEDMKEVITESGVFDGTYK